MHKRFVSFLFFFTVSTTSILFFIIAAILRFVTYPFDKRLRALHQLTCFWASLYTWIFPWRIRIEGREKFKNNTTYMVVSNHQSQLDILVAFRLFRHFKWVSKAEIFKVPLIGWNMALNRYIKIKRGVKDSIEKMMEDAEARLGEGSSVYFFPEGTRSHDGKVKAFKHGAFTLAKKCKVPILPIVITGTMKALPKYSINFHGIQKICMRVLDEIPYQAFANLSIEETAEMVRQVIIKNLKILEASMYPDVQESNS
ncbi:MAG: 1-acyl-sn-glycerol-3-phosphate acyltransferase [Spirochaetes bacterium]|jgi:1-acyl-sn-glycerol-3-phosphate acyltransferase|nr:1-acyl-sn-glycerol-3-phosphate acyltransferase [Spirochaetota bacterium]